MPTSPRLFRVPVTGVCLVMARRPAQVLLAVLSLILVPATASGQIMYGGHFAQARDTFGGATGFGVRVGVGLPAFPVELLAGGEYYFPGCAGIGGCGFSGLSVDANFHLPIPLASPYVTGGWVIRRLDPAGDGGALTRSGVHLGAGVGTGLAGPRLFGEARYEFVEAPERQFILRLGVLIGG